MKKVLIIGAVILVALIVINQVRDNDTSVKDATEDPSPDAIAYNCGGEQVHVDFNNDTEPQTADIYFDNKSQVLSLPVVESASGAKYSNDTVTFWTHQDEATFEHDGETLECVEESTMPSAGGDMGATDIPEGCVSWFDGCNNCSVGEEGAPMACTMMFCETPAEPYCLEYEDGSSDAPMETAVSPGVADGLTNTTYNIQGEEVTLVDGQSSVPAAPGSATMVETRTTEFTAEGDLQQGTGATMDGSVVLVQEPGGSGTFYYVGAVLEQPNASYTAAENTYLLGDRITVKSMDITDRVITVTYLTRSEDQAMTDAPTVEVTKQFATSGNTLLDVTKN